MVTRRSLTEVIDQYSDRDESDSGPDLEDEMDAAPKPPKRSDHVTAFASHDDDTSQHDDDESISLGLGHSDSDREGSSDSDREGSNDSDGEGSNDSDREGSNQSEGESEGEESDGGWQDEEDETSNHSTGDTASITEKNLVLQRQKPGLQHGGPIKKQLPNVKRLDDNVQWKSGLGATASKAPTNTATSAHRATSTTPATLSPKNPCNGDDDDDYSVLIAGVLDKQQKQTHQTIEERADSCQSSDQLQRPGKKHQQEASGSRDDKKVTKDRKKQKQKTGTPTDARPSSVTNASGAGTNSCANVCGKSETVPRRNKKQDQEATEEHMEKLRQQRADRMQKVRERIEREKQEEERRKSDEEQRQADLAMSEEGRRDRAYAWYIRCGQLNRDELKKRISGVSQSGEGSFIQVTTADIDLLPWNFNGSMVNASRMMALKKATATTSY